jgi:alanyl-tRNA synthetase
MMREQLYHQDTYLATFSAHIVERVLMQAGRLAVVLDHTAFFPGTSGFPADRGWLNKVQVVELMTRPEDGEILHVLSEEIWDNEVQARIDWPRRLDFMRQHTAGHLLANALAQTCGAAAVGITVNEGEAFLDLERSNVSPAQIEQAETAANEAVLSHRAVRAAVVTAAQATKIGLVPLSPKGYLLPGTALVQVMNIEGTGPMLCEGVHVAQTSEVGLIKVIGSEVRGEGLRVRFASGAHALAEFRHLEQSLAQIAASLKVPVTNVSPAVTRLMSELTTTQKELGSVRSAIAGFEAEALAASAEEAGGVLLARRVYAERDIATLRQLARLITARPGYVVMLGIAGSKAQLLFIRSANVRHDMTVPIRIAAQVLNTQGGGQPAQAESIPVRADEARVEAALTKAVKWLQAQS